MPPPVEPGTPPQGPLPGLQPPPHPQSYVAAPTGPPGPCPSVPIGPPRAAGVPHPWSLQPSDPLGHLLPLPSNKRPGLRLYSLLITSSLTIFCSTFYIWSLWDHDLIIIATPAQDVITDPGCYPSSEPTHVSLERDPATRSTRNELPLADIFI